MSSAVKRIQPPPAPRPNRRSEELLQSGDRMNRIEFERRYGQTTESFRAELVEGVVYVSSPVRHGHSESDFGVVTWAGYYSAFTPGVEGGHNGTVRLDLDNEPQPDALLRIREGWGGMSKIDEDDYVCGAVEWVSEVALSSLSYDLHDKLRAYQRNGVKEYLVWRVQDRAIDWFILKDGKFQPMAAGADGILRSEVFPGLWLKPEALLAGDMAGVLAVLQQGLTSPEHAAFVAKLKAKHAELVAKAPPPGPTP